MTRTFFLKTNRIGFSKWKQDDKELAELLWGDEKVTKYICASGHFCTDDIQNRLNREIENNKEFSVQYWPIFELTSNELVGCCGLRPYAKNEYEIGVHLCSKFWGKGYATEAANAVINYAFEVIGAKSLFAGHNPNNTVSKKLLKKLGFSYIGDEFYEPTGLYHPSYELRK
jgi:RimJ/RimL family protein N-acetyltransferase